MSFCLTLSLCENESRHTSQHTHSNVDEGRITAEYASMADGIRKKSRAFFVLSPISIDAINLVRIDIKLEVAWRIIDVTMNEKAILELKSLANRQREREKRQTTTASASAT